jgi:hypothetical protein
MERYYFLVVYEDDAVNDDETGTMLADDEAARGLAQEWGLGARRVFPLLCSNRHHTNIAVKCRPSYCVYIV